jgi:hypothetical protein
MMKNTPKRDGDSYCFFMTTLIKKNTSFYKTLNIAGYLLTGIISLFLLTYMKTTYAINASPHPINATQPDGTQIVLRVKGDERFHWQEDANGYTVLRNQGRYVYATRGPSGHLVPSDLEVGKASPKAHGLQKRILPSKAIINQQLIWMYCLMQIHRIPHLHPQAV